MSQVISSADFQSKVLDADKPVLVDFFATWCGPCKRVGPVLDAVGEEVSGKAYVYKVDIDMSQDIAAKYQVNSVPTMILFKDGMPAKKMVGAHPKQDILSLFD